MKVLSKVFKMIFVNFFFAGVFFTTASELLAQVTLPSPGDSVLIIYTNDSCDGNAVPGYEQAMVTGLETALSAANMPAGTAPTITTLETPCSTTASNGFYSSIPGGNVNYLNQFCEVFDLRFISWSPTANSSVEPCTAAGQSDVITAGGATSDTQLFLNYLAQGGHLILLGDNAGFCPRDASVLSFLGVAVPGCNLGFPTTGPLGVQNWTTFLPPLQGALNTLTTYGSDVTGYITAGNTCGATSLTTNGSEVLDMLWKGTQLTGGNGQLEFNVDTNGLEEGMTGYIPYWQNVYAINSICFNFTLTKTVAPTQICVGGPATFTICMYNSGTKTIPSPQITDPLPSCLTYAGSNPASTQSGSTVIFSGLPSIASGSSDCVSIFVTANSVNCP